MKIAICSRTRILSLSHLPALVHGVDAGSFELLELVAGLVAGSQGQLALGAEIDGNERFLLWLEGLILLGILKETLIGRSLVQIPTWRRCQP